MLRSMSCAVEVDEPEMFISEPSLISISEEPETISEETETISEETETISEFLKAFLKEMEELNSPIQILKKTLEELEEVEPKDKKTIKKLKSQIEAETAALIQALIFWKASQLGFDLNKFEDTKPIIEPVTFEKAELFFRSEEQKQYSCGRKGGEPNRDFSGNKVFFESPTIPGARSECNFEDPNDPVNKHRVIIGGQVIETGVWGRGHYYNFDVDGKSGNPAADGAVTITRSNGKKAFGAIYRADNGNIAMPGGNVEKGDRKIAIVTAIREFLEELHSECSILVKLRIIEILLKGIIRVIKNSIMLDARITNNASVTSVVFHFDIVNVEDSEYLANNCDPCVDETLKGSGYINIDELNTSEFWDTHKECLEVILL